MNWLERLGVKVVIGRVKRVKAVGTFLRRWGPLVAVIGLATKTYLEGAGEIQAASTLDFVLRLLHLTVTDPEMAASVVANSGATYKFGKLLVDAAKAAPVE